MGKSSGSSERPVTEEEKALWDSQAENLDMLTKIAEDQYNLSAEDRSYYEEVFRDGDDTEAKQAIAKLKGQITGQEVDPSTIDSVNIDSLLRDTILNSTPEFQSAAANLVSNSKELTSNYGAEVTGLSESFSKTLSDYNTSYQSELQSIKEQTGTINQDILSREVGAASAGISTAFAESRKQMTADLARRGLSGSGIEANVLSSNYQQEAMSKAQASSTARTSALQQSEAVRQQQAALAGQQLQTGASIAGQQYNTELGATQNIYGTTTAADMQNYQTTQAATLQGIAGLTQVAQAGTGLYAGSQNYLAQAASTAGSAASTAGSSAVGLANVNQSYAQMQSDAAASSAAGIGSLVGTVATAGVTGGGSVIGNYLASDKRLKTNITFIEKRNGHNIYSWDWIEGHDYGYNEGVIAQEVMETNPEAVIMTDSGYYAVNYNTLGV